MSAIQASSRDDRAIPIEIGHPEPERRGNAANDVYRGLRDDILSGEYAPGDALVEDMVAGKYGVSRTPVRAGLLLLAQDGLVTIPRSGGAVVGTITVRDVVEIFEMRQAIEGHALANSTARLDRRALEELARAYELDADTQPAEGLAPEVLLYSTDTKLHQLILDSLGNDRATNMLRVHSQQISRVRALLWRMADPLIDMRVTERNMAAAHEHRRIIDLLLTGDMPAAQGELIEHLRKGCDSLIQLMMAVNIDSLRTRGSMRQPAQAALLNDSPFC